MKLVLTFVETDGYTYSTENTYAFEYESVEALQDVFKATAFESMKADNCKEFSISGSTIEFHPHSFFERLSDKDAQRFINSENLCKNKYGYWLYQDVCVQTLDDWFESKLE